MLLLLASTMHAMVYPGPQSSISVGNLTSRGITCYIHHSLAVDFAFSLVGLSDRPGTPRTFRGSPDVNFGLLPYIFPPFYAMNRFRKMAHITFLLESLSEMAIFQSFGRQTC
jgi:hypothetical protein